MTHPQHAATEAEHEDEVEAIRACLRRHQQRGLSPSTIIDIVEAGVSEWLFTANFTESAQPVTFLVGGEVASLLIDGEATLPTPAGQD